jgi:hypothetical protein
MRKPGGYGALPQLVLGLPGARRLLLLAATILWPSDALDDSTSTKPPWTQTFFSLAAVRSSFACHDRQYARSVVAKP